MAIITKKMMISELKPLFLNDIMPKTAETMPAKSQMYCSILINGFIIILVLR